MHVRYVVDVGRQTEVFSSQDVAHAQVVDYSGGCRKKYGTKKEAMALSYGLAREQEKQSCILWNPWRTRGALSASAASPIWLFLFTDVDVGDQLGVFVVIFFSTKKFTMWLQNL